MRNQQLFDTWPEAYEQWFQTPIGQLVKTYEAELILELAAPKPVDHILDVGCGTGIFTQSLIQQGARTLGVDISIPMLISAQHNLRCSNFTPLAADMARLPFADNAFDKVISITAIEFIRDGAGALSELMRTTRPGGRVVVATLNRLSSWSERRHQKARHDPNSVFHHALFRSPEELLALTPIPGVAKTAVFFDDDDEPSTAQQTEADGRARNLMTGAFAVVCWQKPDDG